MARAYRQRPRTMRAAAQDRALAPRVEALAQVSAGLTASMAGAPASAMGPSTLLALENVVGNRATHQLIARMLAAPPVVQRTFMVGTDTFDAIPEVVQKRCAPEVLAVLKRWAEAPKTAAGPFTDWDEAIDKATKASQTLLLREETPPPKLPREGQPEARPNPVQTFLNQYPVLRIFIPVAQGRGHQSASVALVERLRILGYKGRIDFIYQQGYSRLREEEVKRIDNLSKLALILPGVDKEKSGVQELKELKIRVMSQAEFEQLNEPELAIGMTGAVDNEQHGPSREPTSYAKLLKVLYFLQLQPMSWSTDSGRRGISDQKGDMRYLEGLEQAEPGYRYADVKPEEMSDELFFELQLKQHPRSAEAIAIVQSILSAEKGERVVDSLAVYGMTTGVSSDEATFALIRLVGGVLEAQKTRHKGVVLPYIGQLADATKFQEIKDEDERKAQIRQADDERFRYVVEYLARTGGKVRTHDVSRDKDFKLPADGEVVLVRFPDGMPREIFEFLFASTSFPNASEGANTLDKDRQRKGAYLHTGKLVSNKHPSSEQLGWKSGEMDNMVALSGFVGKILAGKYAQDMPKPLTYLMDLFEDGIQVRLPAGEPWTNKGRTPLGWKISARPKAELVALEKKGEEPIPVRKEPNQLALAQANAPEIIVGQFLLDSIDQTSMLYMYFQQVKSVYGTLDQVAVGVEALQKRVAEDAKKH